MVKQGVDERAGLAARGGMGGHAGRLVDHDEVLILEQDGQWNILGLRVGGDGRRHEDAVLARSGRSGAGRQDVAVEGDGPCRNQRLKPGARDVGQGITERLVQPGMAGVEPDLKHGGAVQVVVRVGGGHGHGRGDLSMRRDVR